MVAVEAHGERTRGWGQHQRPFMLVLAGPPQAELLNGGEEKGTSGRKGKKRCTDESQVFFAVNCDDGKVVRGV